MTGLLASLYLAGPIGPIKDWQDFGGVTTETLPNKETVKVATLKGLEAVFANLLAVATSAAGLAVFVMLIWGGLAYLFSGGNPEKVKKATAILTWAIIGLILLLGSWFIIRFLEEFTGVKLTKFEIPG